MPNVVSEVVGSGCFWKVFGFVCVKKRRDLGSPTEFGVRKRFHSFKSNQFYFDGEGETG